MTQLFDRDVVEQHRRRAARHPADFLHLAAADEVQERLQEVNRQFTATTIVTGHPTVWAKRLPARVIPDDDTLDLQENSADLVVHALCLHWAEDPVGQLVQCRRALRPDGLFLCTLFGGQTLFELRACLAEAETRISGGLSPRVSPMAEVRALGSLLQRAGFALPVADVTQLTVSYPSALHLMQDLRAMGETNALSGRLKHFSNRQVLRLAAQIYGENFADGNGRIKASFDIITLTGWAPASNQPKPLRPGSATARLAAALGTTESPLDRSSD